MIINQMISKEKKEFNIFVALLRIYLSFTVVSSHCYSPSKYIPNKKYLNLLFKKSLPVPTFFIMSFYFCQNFLSSKNIPKIKQRFERIIIPYFIWPIIIWIVNNYFKHSLNWKVQNSFNDLKLQLMTGHCFLTVLWFQYNLIFTTLLITIIEFLFFKKKLFILINLFSFSYYFQYSNLNYEIFSIYSFNKKYPLGRFFEILPFCVTGYIIAFFNIKIILKNYRIFTIYLLLIILAFIIKYQIFIKVEGFMYQGIYLLIVSSVLFIITLMIPSEKIKNKYIIDIIKLITSKTPGIYFLHTTVANYFCNFIKLIKNRTFFGCVIIYITCYFICFLGIKIFGKSKFRNLFQ